MIYALISSISESVGAISDKLNLNSYKRDPVIFTTTLFVMMALCSLPLLFFSRIDKIAFTFYPLLILALIIIGSAIQACLFYVALKNMNISSLEPIRNSEPILVIMMAFIFYPGERDYFILLIGFICTAAIIYSQSELFNVSKFKFRFDRYVLIIICSIFISALLNIAYKFLLDYYPPILLYCIRAIGVAVLLLVVFRPKIRIKSKKQGGLFFFSAVLYTIASVAMYFSIANVGIGATVIMLCLSPTLVYLLSNIILKEKLTKNKIIASIIITACVAVILIRSI